MSASAESPAPARGYRIADALPALRWLGQYEVGWLRGDLIAGVTLAAYLLPAGIADASLAGLPSEAGLYACLFSGLVFWLFCSSQRTAITVTSAISLLLGSSLGALAGGDPSRFGALASCTALLVALLGLLAWIAKAGTAINFVSESVMIGFKAGVALYLASTQLPKLFGFKGTHGDFWERSHYFLQHLGDRNAVALTLGVCALVLLLAGKFWLKRVPMGLIVIVAGIVVAAQRDLGAQGVQMLGEVPQGLPVPGLPAVAWRDLNELLPLALACFMLGAVETAAIGRMFAAKHGGRLDSNQEFLALAAANLASGLGRGFPVSGGMSQSLVNEGAGARTPLSGLFAAAIVLVVTLFLSGLLRTLPQPVLAAVVLVAVTGLFKVSALKELWRVNRAEFVVAMCALLGVLGSGLLRGVLIGAVISLVQLLRRASRPHVAFLGRIPGTRRFSDLARHDDNQPVPGVLIFRVEASLVYFNAEYVGDAVVERVRAMQPKPELVLGDLSASPYCDIHGAKALEDLHQRLAALGVRLQLVEARSSVRDRLRASGLEESIGRINRFTSVADAIDEFQRAPAGG